MAVGTDEDDLVAAVRRLRTAFVRFDEMVAKELGLVRSDLRALELLEHGPVAVGTIAEDLRLGSGSVTGLIDRLERQDLVERRPAPDDRRKVLVALRTDAYATVLGLYGPCIAAIDRVAADLSDADRLQVRRAVVRIADNITDAVEPRG